MFWCKPHAERPVYYDLDECTAIVERCALTSSAVTFPSFDVKFIQPGELNGYIEYSNVENDEEDTLVEWRCYRNGEFRYRSNFWELGDAYTQQRIQQKTIYVSNVSDPKCLGLINLVSLAYRIAAAHVFAERLLRVFSATVDEIKSGIDGVAGYGLGRIDESQRFPRAPFARGNDSVYCSTEQDLQHGFDPYVMAGETLVAFCRHFYWETSPATFSDLLTDVRELAERF